MAKKNKNKNVNPAETGGQIKSLEQIVDQHPRPVSNPSINFSTGTAESAAAMAAAAAACTVSTIHTTGSNGDEDNVVDENGDKNYIGNFHKGMHHNAFGEVIVADYLKLLNAMNTKTQASFNDIPRDLGRKYVNPQAGLATDLEGPNPKNMKMRSAPKVGSAEAAAEAVELYWMALLRDVPFIIYESSSDVADAAEELSNLNDFTGPKEGGKVIPQTIFRGCSAGSTIGPPISQFLVKDIPYGSLTISQKQKTVLGESVLGIGNTDYLTNKDEWLAIQNGRDNMPLDHFDGARRYIRNMRDLGQYVHVDALYEAYLNACLIILGAKNPPWDEDNPYHSSNPASGNRIGFGTFGGPHILSLVCEAATRALKVVWYQKWFVHRRLRPEAYGGLVHFKKKGERDYDLDGQILNSVALQRTFDKFHTYFMPMAFPEGSPTHPAYGAGHATVAGACVTILKAFFNESAKIENPVIPTADGLDISPYTGTDANNLTLGGELNKLAANIAIGRNMAGVHWRSDYYDSIRLGERVATCILAHQRNDYHEPYAFNFTNFNGEEVTIDGSGVVGLGPGQEPCKDRDEDVL